MKPDKSLILLAIAAALALLAVAAMSQIGGGPGLQPQGKALVGGAFSLTDHTGKRVTEKDYRGKYLLVYFGYTHCPEICPLSLQSITTAMERLGPLGDEITPLFITVDPARDGVAQIADYVSNFDRRTVGLTGSKEELAEASKAYRVYSKRVESDDAVDFDHSAITFLMDRNGDYVRHFAYGVDGDVMAAQIRDIFAKREPQKLSAISEGGAAR